MRALALAGSCLASCLWLSLPGVASAQTVLTVEPYGDRTWSTTNGATTFFINQAIGEAECLANTPIVLNFTGLPTGTLYLSLWRTSGTSDCSRAASRMITTGMSICTWVETWAPAMVVGPTVMGVELPPNELFPDCTVDGRYRFYIIATTASGDRTTDLASGFVYFDAQLDTTAPTAPTNVMASDGDSRAEVTWDNPTSAEMLREAHIWAEAGCSSVPTDAAVTDAPRVDSGAVDSGDLDAGDLDADLDGGDLDAGDLDAGMLDAGDLDAAIDLDGGAGGGMGGGSDPYAVVEGTSPTSYVFDPEAFGLDYGESAAVSVSLVDRAGNEGPRSTPVCITRVMVEGFWERWCRDNHPELTIDQCRARYAGCSCRVAGGRGSAGAGLALGISALLFALAVRRSRA